MMTKTRAPLRLATAVAMALPLMAAAGPATGAGVDREDAVEPFVGDVYVVDGSTLRNPTGSTDVDTPLFNDSGASLGVTWGQWRSAAATSMAVQIGGPNRPRTDVRLRLEGLIPDGVYSAFYATFGPDSEHPQCPGVERLLPLTSLHGERQHPDPSAFVADGTGSAVFHGRVDGRLLDADQVLVALIYQFDEQSHHPFPNRGELLTHDGSDGCRSSFGHDAMRQMLVLQKW